MTDQDDKVRENRLRRWAKRLGLEISKSRARTFKVDDLGGWQVRDRAGEVLAGARFELSLDGVEEVLEVSQEWVVEETLHTDEDGKVLLQEVRARHLYPDEFRERLRGKIDKGKDES